MPRDDLATRLLLAIRRGDERALASLLNPDVVMIVDTGDQTGGDVRGHARVIRSLLQPPRMPPPDAWLEKVHVNGGPGVAVRAPDGAVIAVLVIDPGSAGDEVGRLWFITAPRKLAHWNPSQIPQLPGQSYMTAAEPPQPRTEGT